MSNTRWFLTAIGLSVLAACSSRSSQKPPPLSPLKPDVNDRVNADFQRSIDHYVATAPKKKDYLQAGLNPKMSELQGDRNDPVPTSLGLLKSAPAPTATGLDALSPIAVSATKAKLRDKLQREPTTNDVLNAIAAEDQARLALGDMLEMHRAEIAAIYADVASLRKQGKTNQVVQRLKDLRQQRAAVLDQWHQQQGIVARKRDPAGGGLTPKQIVGENRTLLINYLNENVTQSR